MKFIIELVVKSEMFTKQGDGLCVFQTVIFFNNLTPNSWYFILCCEVIKHLVFNIFNSDSVSVSKN